MNMYKWLNRMVTMDEKKALPILAFPAAQLLTLTVKELASNSNAQAMGMKMIADRYDMPAAIGFMDLSVEAEAFGSHTIYAVDEVPTIYGHIVQTQEEADALRVPEVGAGRTGIYVDGIRKALKLITDRPVFAECIGPFSLAGRITDVNDALAFCYEEPEMMHTVLRKATDFLLEYIEAFKRVGAHGIVMAEPLAGLLSPTLAQEFSCDYVREIVEKTQKEDFIILYHNCGTYVSQMTDQLLTTGCRAFHFGEAVDMADMLRKMPADCLLLGNVSPAKYFYSGDARSVQVKTMRLLEECGDHPNFHPSSGCDLPPMTELENIDAFFEAVRTFNYKQQMLDIIA